MKNALKFSSLLCFMVILLSSASSVLSAQVQMDPPTPCSSPSASVTGQTANSISFSWSAVSGATGYKVWYVRTDNPAIGEQQSTENNYFTFPGLASGTYNFYFVTECEAGMSEVFIIVDVMI